MELQYKGNWMELYYRGNWIELVSTEGIGRSLRP